MMADLKDRGLSLYFEIGITLLHFDLLLLHLDYMGSTWAFIELLQIRLDAIL